MTIDALPALAARAAPPRFSVMATLRSASRISRSTTDASRTKASRAAHALLELLHLDHVGRVDALKYQLGNAIPFLDGEVRLSVVEQQYLDLAAVVSVNDACARVDEIFDREARARRDTAV